MALTQEQADAIATGTINSASSGGLGWNDVPQSSAGAGWGAGKAGWKGGWGHIGQLLGMDNADFIKRMDDEAAFYQRNSPGATQFFGEEGVTGTGDLGGWLAYNAASSLPYMLEMAAGGVGGGLARGSAMGAAKTLGRGAVDDAIKAASAVGPLPTSVLKAAEDTALKQVATRYAAGAGATAASYPSAVGDILGNQAQAGDEYDGVAALAGGVPYALANLLGGEGAILKAVTGGLKGNTAKGILQGAGGYAKAMGRAGVMEGIGETGQEVINQTFGRMAVNPDETLTSGDALSRYAESFMAGMGLGAPIGGASHFFAKPELRSLDDIAARNFEVQSELDLMRGGHETWSDRVEQTRKDAEEYQKEQDAAEKAAEKAFYDQVEKEEQEKKDLTKNRIDLATQFEKLKQMRLDTEKMHDEIADTATPAFPQADWVQGVQKDFPNAEWSELMASLAEQGVELPIQATPEQKVAVLHAAGVKGAELIRAQQEAKGQRGFFGTLSQTPFEEGTLFNPFRPPLELTPPGETGAETPPAPADLQQRIAMARLGKTPMQQAEAAFMERVNALNALGGNTTTVDDAARVRADVAELDHQARVEQFNRDRGAKLAGEPPLFKLAREQRERRERAEQEAELIARAAQPVLNKKPAPIIKSAMQQALEDTLKPLQEDTAWQLFLAEKEAQKQAEIDAAHAQRPATNRDAKLVQGDMIGFENQAVAKPRNEIVTEADLSNFNEWQAEGLQISADWEVAKAAKDTAALDKLEKKAEALYERMAIGFPKAPGTDEMFQLREDEGKPRVTPAGKLASGNMFKNPPPKKETTRGTQAPETKQAESPTPPAEARTATPDAGAVSEETQNEEVQGQAPAEEVKPDLNTLLREKIEKDEPAPKAEPAPRAKVKIEAGRKAATTVADLKEQAEKAREEKSPAPASAPYTTNEVLPELDAPWNVRKENRTRVEKLAAKGDEARIAREWNEQYGNKFQYPELSRDLQLLIKHAMEAIEPTPSGRSQSKMSIELADRVELEQEIRNREERPNDIENAVPAEAAQRADEEAQAEEVADPTEGIPKSLFAKVKLEYNIGEEQKQGTAAKAIKEIDQAIDDYTAFLKCLTGGK